MVKQTSRAPTVLPSCRNPRHAPLFSLNSNPKYQKRMLMLHPAALIDANHYNNSRTFYWHEEAVLYGRSVEGKHQIKQFGLFVLVAMLLIPLGYVARGISESNAMNILQIIAVFVVEAVRMFP